MNNKIVLEPFPSEWITSEKKDSLLSLFLPLYKDLVLFSKIDDCLQIWIKIKVVEEVLESSLSDELTIPDKDILNSKHQLFVDSNNKPNKKTHDEFLIASKNAIHLWSQSHWENKIHRLFLAYKNQLDLISCYYMRIKKRNLANEIYHRINNDEQDFSRLGLQYGIGKEKYQGSHFEGQPLTSLPSKVIPIVRTMKEGQLLKPFELSKDTYALLRMEKLISATLDHDTITKIYKFSFEEWSVQLLSELHSIIVSSL